MHCRLCHMPILTDLIALLKILEYIVVSPSRRSRSTFGLSHVLALFILAWVGICSEPCPHSMTTTQTSVAVRVNCVTVATILDEYIWRFAERERRLYVDFFSDSWVWLVAGCLGDAQGATFITEFRLAWANSHMNLFGFLVQYEEEIYIVVLGSHLVNICEKPLSLPPPPPCITFPYLPR